MAELGAFFGNPNIQRQGARARALAGQRDVNTLPDPLTYAVMQGLLGTRPDEMGFSVLNPNYEKIKKVAEPAFALGLLGQAAPVLAPLTKGLPVGASIKNVGTKLRVKPPTDDVYEVMDATFEFAKLGGNKTLPIDQLTGGVRTTDPTEVKRVKELANKISSPEGYISRIIVDDLGNVLEGQHRLEALRLLGEKNVPVSVIEDLSNKYDIAAMKKALEGKFRSDETRQLLKHSIDTLEEAGSIDKALSDFAMPAKYQKPFEDAIKASKLKPSSSQQEALDVAQTNAALPIEEGLLATQSKQPMQGLLGQEVTDYRGSHQAPSSDFGAPLYDLTGGGQMYPADVYSSKAAQFYGGNLPYDQKAFSIAQQYKDKPDALITIYRAVPKEASNSEKLATLEKQMSAYMKRGTLPKDADNYSNGSKWYDAAYDERDKLRKMSDEPSNDISTINAGDWVTLTKEYAKDHGESALKGEYKILSKKVKAKEVWTNADSIHEFGYQPQASATDEQKLKQITSLLE
jgi:hypothetical protein